MTELGPHDLPIDGQTDKICFYSPLPLHWEQIPVTSHPVTSHIKNPAYMSLIM